MLQSQQQQPQVDDTNVLHVVLTTIPTEHMSPTELEDLEDDRLIDLFLDYDVPYNVIEALRMAGIVVDDQLSDRYLPRLLELLQSEQNVVITAGVAEQIEQAIAYATMPLKEWAHVSENTTN